jgi:hypothetical protein
MQLSRRSVVAAIVMWAATIGTGVSAEDNFYAGKAVQIVVGFTAGYMRVHWRDIWGAIYPATQRSL